MKRKIQEKNKDKIEARFAKRKQKMNSLKKKMLKRNLIIWSKYRWNIEKLIFGKLISLTFSIKKLGNLQAVGVKTWLM